MYEDILNYYIYLGYLDLAVWRCYISFLFRWNGSDVLLYGGLHTYSFVYVVDPFACRLRRPFLSRCLEMVGMAERSTCEWHLGPTILFQPFLIIQACTRSVIHRGSYIVHPFITILPLIVDSWNPTLAHHVPLRHLYRQGILVNHATER